MRVACLVLDQSAVGTSTGPRISMEGKVRVNGRWTGTLAKAHTSSRKVRTCQLSTRNA